MPCDKAPPITTPVGDVINILDNTQKVGRKQNVRPSNKAKCSVITTTSFLQFDSNGSLQNNLFLKPTNILTKTMLDEQLQNFTNITPDTCEKLYTSCSKMVWKRLYS